MTNSGIRRTIAAAALLFATTSAASLQARDPERAAPAKGGADATIQVPAFALPFSGYASPEARRLFLNMQARPPMPTDLAARIAAEDKVNEARVARMRQLYAVDVAEQAMGGVRTDIVTPRGGIPRRNRGRVLINLHGGGFLWGSRSGGLVESIPIAATAGIKVVTIDYRMAPRYRFPAASEDIAAVYRALLKTYRAGSIGIYGCSAGAVLTGEAVAWFAKVGLPRPGAIGMFCSSIVAPGGDSLYRAAAESGKPLAPDAPALALPYFAGANLADPLVFPANAPAIVARFPPTLLITGTRDFAEGSVLQAHRLLRNAGVHTELNVWEGMWHSFMSDPDMPESREAYRTVADFFGRELGQ